MALLIRPPEPPGDTEDIARIRAALTSSNLAATDVDIAWAWRQFSRSRDVDWLKIGRDWPYQDIIDDKDIVFKMLQHLHRVPATADSIASPVPSGQSPASSPTT